MLDTLILTLHLQGTEIPMPVQPSHVEKEEEM